MITADLTIQAPEIEYAMLAPLFIISGVAVLGVVVEAMWPRRSRFAAQAILAVVGVTATLVDTVWVFQHLDKIDDPELARGLIGAEGAVAIDGPGVFTWGILLVFALMSMLLFAERRLEGGLSAFTGRAADAPGSAGEAEAIAKRIEHSEVFPLAMFSLVGMMLFATSNDLLTMFVALEVLSLPL